jgi:hypothetical protein
MPFQMGVRFVPVVMPFARIVSRYLLTRRLRLAKLKVRPNR